MFHLIRTVALQAFALLRRLYMAAPASPYEAILFNYIKATLAQMFFKEVVRGAL